MGTLGKLKNILKCLVLVFVVLSVVECVKFKYRHENGTSGSQIGLTGPHKTENINGSLNSTGTQVANPSGIGFIHSVTQELLKVLSRGFKEYLNTNIRPLYLRHALKEYQIPNFFQDNLRIGNTILKATHNLEADVLCGLCSTIANFIVGEIKNGITRTQLKSEVVSICEMLNIASERVCDGAIDLNIDIVLYIIDTYPNILPDRYCDIALQEFKCNYTNLDWHIDVPDGQSPTRPSPTGVSTFKILHITDLHLDDMYTPKKVKTCNEPVCCQSDQEDGSEGNSCGYWADYGNDVSEHLVDEMIRFANTLDFNYVYFTGDIISHRVWNTTKESNSAHITKLLTKLKNGFKVPVYPTLGNHEPSPLNQYESLNLAPSNLSTHWLYELIEKEWSNWLPQSTLETISKGGFYTVSPKEGFRLIVLNSNVAYTVCWWLVEKAEDPNEELDWLISILSQAEAKNESVHILSHIPTGNIDLHKIWGREYNKIINRFANTITGQFNGHSHFDQFQVYFNNSNPDQAINVAWNGASLTPYDHGNPNVKVYTVDEATFNIIDIDEYTFNLTLANENPDKNPEWYNLYSFKKAYDIPSLQPKDIGDLLVKMATNHSRLIDYHLFRYKMSDPAITYGCNEDCQKEYLCEMSTSVFQDTTKCDYLKEIYDKNLKTAKKYT